MKNLMIGLLIVFTAGNSSAIDISPYKVGQKLNDKQAEELQQRYTKRNKQAWKAPDTLESLASVHP